MRTLAEDLFAAALARVIDSLFIEADAKSDFGTPAAGALVRVRQNGFRPSRGRRGRPRLAALASVLCADYFHSSVMSCMRLDPTGVAVADVIKGAGAAAAGSGLRAAHASRARGRPSMSAGSAREGAQ